MTGTYQELARYPEQYEGMTLTRRGQVIQSMQDGPDFSLRVNVTQKGAHWSDTVWVDYRVFGHNGRILEGDLIQFRAKFIGIKTYTTALGQMIQLPHFAACYVGPLNPRVAWVMPTESECKPLPPAHFPASGKE